MQLVQLDMKQISSEAEIYDCLVGQMNFTNADEKPEWMNVIEMNERDPYDEKKELEKRLERALEDAARTIDERDGKLYAILEDTKPMAFSVI